MEETLEEGRGPPRAVAPLERERERERERESYYEIIIYKKKIKIIKIMELAAINLLGDLLHIVVCKFQQIEFMQS
jgi:hypothetical protein